jgi:hypothetical protein
MPVLSPHKLWPNKRVPYEAADPEIEQWLLQINAATKLTLLVRRAPADPDYVSAKRGGGKSESIGYIPNCGKYKVTADNLFSMQHEILHALGFHHEQLHSKGPWGVFGTKAATKDKIDPKLMAAWGKTMLRPEQLIAPPSDNPDRVQTAAGAALQQSLLKQPRAADAEEKLGRKPQLDQERPPVERKRRNSDTTGGLVRMDSNQQAIDAHMNSYAAAVGDNKVSHYLECDFDSVMMYSEMANAVAAVGLKKNMHRSGKHPLAPCMSNSDVQALIHLYG